MKTITTLLFTTLLIFGIGVLYTPERVDAIDTVSSLPSGYSCSQTSTYCSNSSNYCWDRYTCTKTTYTPVTKYNTTWDAQVVTYKKIYAWKDVNPYTDYEPSTDTKKVQIYYSPSSDENPNGAGGVGCPFIYLYNMPEGEIAVTLDSVLDTYYPKPAFNHTNGWLLNGSENNRSFTENDELFYELALHSVTLNRNGENFSSKEAVATYLENSDFLTQLGLSEREQANTLDYILPEIEKAEDVNYYYLTVLSDEAVADISTLTVSPEPKSTVRQYFAVYPSTVPVKTTDTFVFPEKTHRDGYIAKETGELLISGDTPVFFE